MTQLLGDNTVLWDYPNKRIIDAFMSLNYY